MLAQCQGCSQKFSFDSSPKVPRSKRFDKNVRAVWGSMVIGNGPSHLNEFMATLNSPGLSQPSFSAIETDVGKWWHDVLLVDMLAAGQEERQLAIERKDYHEEVPAITVITDGGWSKRTHKHSYNATGGVAIIIGKETKKLLHIGVRNKYCYLCNHKSSKPHRCFKNWDQDSQSMEGEDFLEAESKHGLRYMRLVGDGDSSVFSRIRQEVPAWEDMLPKKSVLITFASATEQILKNLFLTTSYTRVGYGFLFRSEYFFRTTQELEYFFFCRAKREFFIQNLTVDYMTKTLNQIFFFLHQNQNIFFSNNGNQNIFLEKKHNPPTPSS